MDANTELGYGHLKIGGDVIPNLSFWSQLAIQCMENIIVTYPGDIGRTMWYYRRPQIVEFHM